jgi:hypothetical protein
MAPAERGDDPMRRFVVPALALVVFLISAVAVAGTRTPTLTGTSQWSTDPATFATTTTIQGTFDGRLGRGTYAGTLSGGPPFSTFDCGPTCESVTGTITFSAKRGDFTAIVQSDSVVRLEDIASHSWRSFTHTLVVVSGTRSYVHAGGTLALAYTSTWTHEFVDGVFVNKIEDSGTLTGDPR